MVLNIYSIYDVKTRFYHVPHYCHNDQHAMRMFVMEFTKGESVFNKFPADYHIYHIGTYDDSTGILAPVAPPKMMIQVDQLLAAYKAESEKDENP